jgi:hypothetical protein
MDRFDPEGNRSGTPALASHYRPLIGPYDSGDPNLLEYHVLLIKLAGIDGVMLDWYGTVDLFDYARIHRNALAFIGQAEKTGLAFAVCFEDRTIPQLVERGRIAKSARVEHARRELEWARANWFTRPSYLKLEGKPLFLSFGRDGLSDSEWEQVFADWSDSPLYLSEHDRRRAAAGAFDWPIPAAGLAVHEKFSKDAAGWPVAMAIAFPRFHDIYEQAHVHKSWGSISDEGGRTFAATLERALKNRLPFVQICTWNDWGEGTMIEPSVEFGYRDLEVVQRFRRQFVQPDFDGQPKDLRLAHRLYRLRKDSNKRRADPRALDTIALLLAERSCTRAAEILDQLETRQPAPVR